MMFSVITTSPDQTIRIGQQLGSQLGSGDVVCLYGDLGSGKTSLTFGIALGLDVGERYITSPTYTFVNEYQGRTKLYHIDLYRLEGPSELEGIGFEEYIYPDGVTVIEWADRAEDQLPVERFNLYLSHISEDSREIGFLAEGERYQKLLEALKRDLEKK